MSALRLSDTPEENTEAARLLAFSTETISSYLGDAYSGAPSTILNEAAIRIAGYLFDMPYASRGTFFANSLRNSGAGAMLLPYKVHRGGLVSGASAVAAAQTAIGSSGNPVVDVDYDVATGELIVSFQDGTTQRHTLLSGQAGVDQSARNDAASAQATANSANTAASAAQTTASANTAAIAALPPIPGVPAVFTTGNNDLIDKDKITTATADQYLVISNTGNIIGITPSPGGGGGGEAKWYYVGLLRGNSAQTFVSGTARTVSLSSSTSEDNYRSNWDDYASLKADVDSKAVRQFAVKWVETDADGAASDEKTEVIPNNASFATGTSLDSFISFALGTSPGGLLINFGASSITATPDFSYSGAGANGGLTILIGVWA